MAETVMDILTKARYSENRDWRLFTSSDSSEFVHPFNSEILLNSYREKPPQDLVDCVLNIGKCEKLQNSQRSSQGIEDLQSISETHCYYPFPQEVKSRLREMFVKPRLTVEAKPRGSIDRKVSLVSATSSKRVLLSKGLGLKSRKMSTLDSERATEIAYAEKRASIDRWQNGDEFVMLQNQRRKGSTPKLDNRRRESSLSQRRASITRIQYDKSAITEISQQMNEKIGTRQSFDCHSRPEFFLSPPHYNAFGEGEDASKDTADLEKSNHERVFAWSKKETARRKVATWLRTSCAT